MPTSATKRPARTRKSRRISAFIRAFPLRAEARPKEIVGVWSPRATPVDAVGDHEEERKQERVRHDARPAVGDERERDPGERDEPGDSTDDDEGLEPERRRQAGGEELGKAVVGKHGDAKPAVDGEDVEEDDGDGAGETELLGDRRVDEVRLEKGDVGRPARSDEDSPPEPAPEEPAARDGVDRLDELVPVAEGVAPRVEPDGDARLDPRHDVVEAEGAEREETEPARDVEPPAGGDVEHCEEDGEVEEPAAEVVRLEEDEHGPAPDEEERSEVLGRRDPAGKELAVVAQIPREEDDEEYLGQLAGLEADRPELDPERGAVSGRTDPGERREREERDRRRAERVLVVVQLAVVAQDEHRGREECDRDDDPDALPQRPLGLDPVDRRQADGREERSERQEVRVSVREGDPQDDVGGEVESEEEGRVRERRGRDDRLAGDVDAGEPDGGDEPDCEQVQELAVAEAQGTASSS